MPLQALGRYGSLHLKQKDQLQAIFQELGGTRYEALSPAWRHCYAPSQLHTGSATLLPRNCLHICMDRVHSDLPDVTVTIGISKHQQGP